MGDYGVDPDYDGFVPHAILCRSGWGTLDEKHAHQTVAQVADCYRKARVVKSDPDRYFACSWLVPFYYEDGVGSVDCSALAYSRDDGGFICEAGHEHTPAQVLAERGQAYAEDEEEARQLSKAGVQPLYLVSGLPFA